MQSSNKRSAIAPHGPVTTVKLYLETVLGKDQELCVCYWLDSYVVCFSLIHRQVLHSILAWSFLEFVSFCCLRGKF